MPAIHEAVLLAARRIGRERGDWRFTPEQIVRALPELNVNSVRTHVTSRCCVNAPKNHPHKWDYFRRVDRGVYEILPAMRRDTQTHRPDRAAGFATASDAAPLRDSVHAVISRGTRTFVVECLEVAVATQGSSLDEAVANLREALALHFESEAPTAFGLTASPRLVVTYESTVDRGRREAVTRSEG